MRFLFFSLACALHVAHATAQTLPPAPYTLTHPPGVQIYFALDDIFQEYTDGQTLDLWGVDSCYYIVVSNCDDSNAPYAFSLISQDTGVRYDAFGCCEPINTLRPAQTLPVRFVDIFARPGTGEVELTWTAEESGAVYDYVVQASTDARNWEAKGTVTPAGAGMQTYSASVEAQGATYLRVRSDSDAGAEYSKIVHARATFLPDRTLHISSIVNERTKVYDLTGRKINNVRKGSLYVIIVDDKKTYLISK